MGEIRVTQVAFQPRPLYEQPTDKTREREVIARLSARFGAAAIEFGVGSVCDILLVQLRRPLRLVEVKVRTCASGAYPTYMLSRHKYEDLLALRKYLAIPVSLCVQWTDRAGLLDFPARHEVTAGGRRDRNDPLDVEPVCHFPIAAFSQLWTVK